LKKFAGFVKGQIKRSILFYSYISEDGFSQDFHSMIPIVLILPFFAYLPYLENKVAIYWLMKEREQLCGFMRSKFIDVLFVSPKLA